MVNVCGIVVISVVIGNGYAGLLNLDCAAVNCKIADCKSPKTIPGQCCPICPLHKGCFYQKKFYKHGSSFKDDCNTCFCWNGTVSCTEIACIGESCFYKGKWYKPGAFKDDCNTCHCRDGQVLCTKRACLGCRYGGKYYEEGQRIPQKGNPCKSCYCRNGKIDCDYMMCPAVYCERPLYKPGACCPVCLPVFQPEQ